MNSKLSLLVLALVIVAVVSAGCSGSEGEGDGDGDGGGGNSNLVPTQGTIEEQSGWAQASDEHAVQQVTVTLASKMVTAVELIVNVEDSNEENSETDQGSEADKITIKISGAGNETITYGPQPTPVSANIQIPESPLPEGSYLGQTLTIEIEGDCGGGKTAYFFGLIVWVDQGFEWKVSGTYTFMVEE